MIDALPGVGFLVDRTTAFPILIVEPAQVEFVHDSPVEDWISGHTASSVFRSVYYMLGEGNPVGW